MLGATCTLRVARRCALAVSLAVGAASVAPAALAQPKGGAAKKAYEEGIAHEQAGRWGRALERFEVAQKAAPNDPQVLFHVARTLEQLTRLVEALEQARKAEESAKEQGADNVAEITELRQWLEARAPQLDIRRGEGIDGATLFLDGRELSAEELESPVRMDPGSHELRVVLSDGAEFTKAVTIGAGELQELELERPEGLEAPIGGGGDDTYDDDPLPEDEPFRKKEKPEQDDESTGPGPLPWVFGTVGIVGLGASGIFFALRAQNENDLDSECRENLCPESVRPKYEDAKTFTNLSRISLGVGAVGIGVAAVLFLTMGGDEEPAAEEQIRRRSPRIAVVGDRGFQGVHVSGEF